MAYGYLGELINRNLNSLTSGEGFYEVNNPEIVSSFNNYPDDSHILYKLLFQSDDLNRKYKIYTDIENKITPEILEELKIRHKAVYDHLSGAGSKVIKGVLEIRNFDQTDGPVYNREVSSMQRFFRVNDNISFQRFFDGSSWSEWTYIYTNTFEYLLITEDVILSKKREHFEKAFRHYAPPYDDTRIKEEIDKRIDLDEFNRKLRYKDSEPTGTLTFRGGAGSATSVGGNIVNVSKGPLIIDTLNRRDGTGSFVHSRTPGGFFMQILRAYNGMHLGIGHNGYTRVRFETNGKRSTKTVYPTEVFWNDGNNHDLEIQHLGRLQFTTMDGKWPVSPGNWYTDGWVTDNIEELMIIHSSANNYGYGGTGSFIWPLCTKENVDIYPSCEEAAYSYSGGQFIPDIDILTHTKIRFNRNQVSICCPYGMEFTAYAR